MKKNILRILLLDLVLFAGSSVSALECSTTTGLGPTFIFIGHVIRFAKILIPIVIIGFGVKDLFTAVTGSKDDDIKKAAKTLGIRIAAGVMIFFLPAIVDLVFGWVSEWGKYENDYNACFKCIWDVSSCTTKTE